MTNQQGRLRTRVAALHVWPRLRDVDQPPRLGRWPRYPTVRPIRVIPGLLSFTLVRNPGASLGMGSGATWVISLLAVVACVALAVAGVRTVSMKWSVAISFAFAGALGNLIDRVMYADGFLDGKVVDFLNYGWSVGNVADIYLVVAGVVLVILILMGEPFSHKDLIEQSDESLQSEPEADAK